MKARRPRKGTAAAMNVATRPLLTLEELADRSKVSIHTWRYWVKRRRLPVVRLGRRILVTEADYEAFIARSRD